MSKRILSALLGTALVAGVLIAATPAKAQDPAVPASVNIEDPVGDANYLNDGTLLGQGGKNNTTPTDASGFADLMAVWFTNTADTISVHVQTEAKQPSAGAAYFTAVLTNPEGNTSCLAFQFVVAAPTYQSDSFARIIDNCTGLDRVLGELLVSDGPDGTGIITGTFPRSANPLFADGGALTAPRAEVRNATGPVPSAVPEVGGRFVTFPVVDNTETGTDYAIVSATVEEKQDPPGKNDPPGKGKKKGCKKGKGKKKGACPGKKRKNAPEQCAAYQPGEEGAEAETTVVTDEASEEAPIELTFDAPPGMGNDLVGLGVYDGTESLYHNVQVDTKNPDAGLYVRYEFPDRHDYDLYLNYPDGSYAAFAGDANAAPGEGLGSTQGGSSGTNFEQVDGIRTADCGGYTARLVSFLTTGGETTLKIWLGEVQNEPAAPSGEGLLATVFGLF